MSIAEARCSWCSEDPLMVAYHDAEWGTPLHDEQKHFEFLLLETMQAGLSWSTILKKRENFREAFSGFDPVLVAQYTQSDLERLLENPGIIRNRRKLAAAVNNAKAFLAVQEEFGSFDAYIWHFTGGKVIDHAISSLQEMPVTTELSDLLSKDMKKRGFSFVGSTTLYAHLQAIGVVNDHEIACPRGKELRAIALGE